MHERTAEENRKEGIRSRYQRCPSCHKLRIKWHDANYLWPGNRSDKKRWVKSKATGKMICYVCADPLVELYQAMRVVK